MKARFIGADGSMGLVYGRVYNIQIWFDRDCIYVGWGKRFCPYSNLQKLQENWIMEEVPAEERNKNLKDLILSLVENEYEVCFRKPEGHDVLAMRLIKKSTRGAFVAKDRYVSLDDIKNCNIDLVCFELDFLRKEFEQELKEEEDGQS